MMDEKRGSMLIVDDDPLMRELLASILRSHGHQRIEFAEDGQRAIDLLAMDGCAVELAFIDLDMPGFTGIEVISMIGALHPRCYCVVVSGHSGLDNVTAAIGAGARGFVVKPYLPKRITDVLAKFERERGAFLA